MRKLVIILAALALLPAAHANADSLKVGDIISFSPGTTGDTNGGEYLVYGPNHSGPVLSWTFCIETDKYLNMQDNFMVGGIGTVALSDGNSLHNGSAYLYSQWRSGAIAHTYANATAVQNAIWKFENEGGVSNSLYNTTYGLAGIGNGTDNLGDVRVINLLAKDAAGAYTVDAQDVLTTVPEPTSMLLLGSGLVGLAGAIRRRLRK